MGRVASLEGERGETRMNDALIKMAFDADLLFYEDYPPTDEGYFPSESPDVRTSVAFNIELEDLQKFAQLII